MLSLPETWVRTIRRVEARTRRRCSCGSCVPDLYANPQLSSGRTKRSGRMPGLATAWIAISVGSPLKKSVAAETNTNPASFQMPREPSRATQFVLDAFRATLSDAVPVPFRIRHAKYSSRINHSTSARAVVTMFDDKGAELWVRRYDSGMVSYGWTCLEGGDCSFEDGKWVRVPDTG